MGGGNEIAPLPVTWLMLLVPSHLIVEDGGEVYLGSCILTEGNIVAALAPAAPRDLPPATSAREALRRDACSIFNCGNPKPNCSSPGLNPAAQAQEPVAASEVCNCELERPVYL